MDSEDEENLEADGDGNEDLERDHSAHAAESALASLLEGEHLGPAVKGVFDGSKEQETLVHLTKFVGNKQAEIQEICHYRYREFIHAVDELLEVRDETARLKESLVDLNTNYQASGQLVLSKSRELWEARLVQRNITLTIQVLDDCKYVLGLCEQVNNSMMSRKFYQALTVLGTLQQIVQLHNFEFMKYIERRIPLLRDTLRTEVTSDFIKWLETIRKMSREIGDFAFTQTREQLKKEQLLLDAAGRFDGANQFDASEADQREDGDDDDDAAERKPEDITEVSLFDKVHVDFTPLYQCLYIYKAMNIRDQFENFYKENRKKQALLVLRPLERPFAEVYATYLLQIAGFFVVENHVLETTQSFLSRSVSASLWDMAVVRTKMVLQEQLAYCKDRSVLLQVKQFVFLFSQTMRSYGYNVAPLLEALDHMRNKYLELSVSQTTLLFVEIMESNAYQPLTVTTPAELNELVRAHLLPHDSEKLPLQVSYTKLVPLCCAGVKRFIKDFYEFGEDLYDMDDFVKRATNTVLDELNQQLLSFVEAAPSLHQLTQAAVNLDVLGSAVPDLERYLSQFSHHGATMRLAAQENFLRTKAACEKLIYRLCNQKIDQLMDSADINWMPVTTNKQAREPIQDLMLYFDTALPALSVLSARVRDDIIDKSFGHIATNFLKLLTDDEVRRFNQAAIENLQRDLRCVESMASQRHPTLPRLKEHFVPVHQYVDLLLTERPEELLDAKTRQKYAAILKNKSQLVSVLEKHREAFKATGFANITKANPAHKARVQQLDNIIKALQQ